MKVSLPLDQRLTDGGTRFLAQQLPASQHDAPA